MKRLHILNATKKPASSPLFIHKNGITAIIENKQPSCSVANNLPRALETRLLHCPQLQHRLVRQP